MNATEDDELIPAYLIDWFEKKGWHMHPYQKKMFDFFANGQSVLLAAPTGGGKTLASFLPSLADIHTNSHQGLHTLYISPLKALTQDIHRNLLTPIAEMGLNIEIATRTGDTNTYQRQKQLKKPPHILLTTPESLMLLLSYAHAPQLFKHLKLIIIDELHSIATNKRGDLTTLALAQLTRFAPLAIRTGLSATIANPKLFAKWLVPTRHKAEILVVESSNQPKIHLLGQENIPYSGYKAKHAIGDIYEVITQHQMTIIFVNTRANAEFLFRHLWIINDKNVPIAIYHGSLCKEQRLKTEALTVSGNLKAIVATSALELGIDWGNVDAVIQIGAPHGVSRLLQRIGRSNHRFNQPSLAYLVPTNFFDTLESVAAMHAIANNTLDDEEMHPGSLDVVVQFIMNCACSQPIKKDSLLKTIKRSYSYRHLEAEIFDKLFQFVVDGGYTLKHYPQYHRLLEKNNKTFSPSSVKVMRRHRQNIGTIIEATTVRVKIVNKKKDRVVGAIEESFIQELQPGDTFLFAGEVLEYIRLHDMFVETRKTTFKDAKLPSYNGGTMPLSTFLADEVLILINRPKSWKALPNKVKEWLALQHKFSAIPNKKAILVEQMPHKKKNYLIIYSFEGRRANHSLGMLLTRRLESLKLKPLSFTTSDYGLAINIFKPIPDEIITNLFSSQILYEELENWLHDSSLLKRTFRQIAIISGLTERQIAGTRKSMKQVTFSTDLIYDVLRRYEPEHILLKITRQNVDSLLLDFQRLTNMLEHFHNRIVIHNLSGPSPFSIPLLCSFNTEKISGEAEDEVLSYAQIEANAADMIEEIKQIVG
ncbi:MAG: ligase-associated DNA damage response DEXH box helicase [Legionella sp.]|nr:ligase-associated DNA damage response DEXH box helicase [Legionella sp.]